MKSSHFWSWLAILMISGLTAGFCTVWAYRNLMAGDYGWGLGFSVLAVWNGVNWFDAWKMIHHA